MAEFTTENISPIHIFDTILDADTHKSDITKCSLLQPRASEIFNELSADGNTPDWTECFEKALAELKDLRMAIYRNTDMNSICININHLDCSLRELISDFDVFKAEHALPFTVFNISTDGISIRLDCESIGKYKQNSLKNCVTVAHFFNASVIIFTYRDNLSKKLRVY